MPFSVIFFWICLCFKSTYIHQSKVWLEADMLSYCICFSNDIWNSTNKDEWDYMVTLELSCVVKDIKLNKVGTSRKRSHVVLLIFFKLVSIFELKFDKLFNTLEDCNFLCFIYQTVCSIFIFFCCLSCQ